MEFVLLYLLGSFVLALIVGKVTRWGRTGTTRYTEEGQA